MAKWRKRFAAWQAAKQPVSVDEVESILHRVFGDRVCEHEGTSHRWTVKVPELADQDEDFKFGEIGIPVKSGQYVKGIYLQIAYQAATMLGLPSEEETDEAEEDDEE